MNRCTEGNRRLAFWTPALALLVGFGLSAGMVAAQEAVPADDPAAAPAAADENAAAPAPPPADEQPAAEDSSKKESLGMVIWNSAKNNVFAMVFYVLLGVFSLAAMTVALERLVHLRRGAVIPWSFVRGLRDLVSSGKDTIEDFRTLCNRSRSPIANVLKAGVVRAGRPLPEIEKAMEDTIAREMAGMQSRNRPLSVIGSVAPLVGLLGTVVGMIFAFRVSSEAGLGKAELLAEGIYLALMTTAAGLTIAIPCLLLAAWFNTRTERFMRDIDEILLETMPAFTRVENSTVKIDTPAKEKKEEATAAAS